VEYMPAAVSWGAGGPGPLHLLRRVGALGRMGRGCSSFQTVKIIPRFLFVWGGGEWRGRVGFPLVEVLL
jgi:hypothetical protein